MILTSDDSDIWHPFLMFIPRGCFTDVVCLPGCNICVAFVFGDITVVLWFRDPSQEAFFGKDLLDRSKQNRQSMEPGFSDDDRAQSDNKPASAGFMNPPSGPLLSSAAPPLSAKTGPLRTYMPRWTPKASRYHHLVTEQASKYTAV